MLKVELPLRYWIGVVKENTCALFLILWRKHNAECTFCSCSLSSWEISLLFLLFWQFFISPNLFIHILIFSYSSPSTPSSPYDKPNMILVTPKPVQILWNQPSHLFKIQSLQEVGPRNLFFKIFTGDSYDRQVC